MIDIERYGIMEYCLTVKSGKKFGLLDISLLGYFMRLSKFKDGYSYSLNEIDNFTSYFENDVVFRKYLYDNNIITFDEITKDISIRMKSKKKLVKVEYGLVFSDVKKYFDEVYLKASILSKQNDYDFLNKLLARYRNSYCNNENIALIRNIMIGNSNMSIYRVLSGFAFNEIYSRYYNKQSNEYEYYLKYKSLHDLAMFVYNYDNKKDELLLQKKIDDLKESLAYKKEEYVINTKKRVKRKKEIEGQLSIYDL